MVHMTTKPNNGWTRTRMAVLRMEWKGESRKSAFEAENLKKTNKQCQCESFLQVPINKPIDARALGDHDEGPLVLVIGVDVADRDVGEVLREFPIASGNVVALSQLWIGLVDSGILVLLVLAFIFVHFASSSTLAKFLFRKTRELLVFLVSVAMFF